MIKNILIVIVLSAINIWAKTDSYTLKVVDVIDGDTVAAIDEFGQKRVINLLDVDAPETTQPFGNDSKQALKNVTFNKNITFNKTSKSKGETFANLTDEKGLNINKALVEYGYAWNCSTNKEYSDAAQSAKKDKKGLWGESSQMAPWDYREAVARQKEFQKKQKKLNGKEKKTEKKAITLNTSNFKSHTLGDSVENRLNSSENREFKTSSQFENRSVRDTKNKENKISSQLANHPVHEIKDREKKKNDDTESVYKIIFGKGK